MSASPAPNETRLPRAVQRISADVKAKIAEREQQRAALLNPDPDPASSPASTEIVDPPPPSPPAPAAATPPAPPAQNWRSTTPPQDDPRFDDPQYWRQRFNVTEGRIAAIERERKDEREASRAQVAALQEEVRALKAATPTPEVDLATLFTPEQIAEYGERECRVVATAAMKVANDRIQSEINARLKPLEDARELEAKNRKKDADQSFFDQIESFFPGWQDANKDPRWLVWLAEVDPATGSERQELLDIHVRAKRAQRVAGMFQAWADSLKTPTPPATPHGAGASGDASAGPAPTPAEVQGQRHPSVTEKRDFFKRSALGKVTDAERVAFEARLKLPNPNVQSVRASA